MVESVTVQLFEIYNREDCNINKLKSVNIIYEFKMQLHCNYQPILNTKKIKLYTMMSEKCSCHTIVVYSVNRTTKLLTKLIVN